METFSRQVLHLRSKVNFRSLLKRDIVSISFIPQIKTTKSKLNETSQSIHSSPDFQAGHNRWSKIHRKKAVADLEKSKTIHKYQNRITSVIRTGGGSDLNSNVRLASLITQAKNAGLSKTNIDSAIRSAASRQEKGELVVYEGRAQQGYSLVIEVLTDNKKRTRPNLRLFLSKHGCTLGDPGSSLHNFEYKGLVRVPCKELHAAKTDPMELAIIVGAEDVTADDANQLQLENGMEESESDENDTNSNNDDCYQFKCTPRDLTVVSNAIKNHSFTISSASLEYIPVTLVSLSQQKYDRAVRLVELLSEQDEVMEVYDNFILEEQ